MFCKKVEYKKNIRTCISQPYGGVLSNTFQRPYPASNYDCSNSFGSRDLAIFSIFFKNLTEKTDIEILKHNGEVLSGDTVRVQI